MTTTEQRYARQRAVNAIGEIGQARIANARVLLIGVGGIGNPVAAYLGGAGIGRLILNDFDDVDESNLARQVLFEPGDIGRNKAVVAATVLQRQNPSLTIEVIEDRLDDAALSDVVASVSLVIDATDSFITRHRINRACVLNKRLLLSGAAIRCEGQVAEFGPDYATSACYACVYPESDEILENCAQNGVVGPVAGAIGCHLAARALLRLCGQDASLQLSIFDALRAQWNQLRLKKRADCPVCNP